MYSIVIGNIPRLAVDRGILLDRTTSCVSYYLFINKILEARRSYEIIKRVQESLIECLVTGDFALVL